jgi:DeoR/GlpR family transcriptional regulator of sugar metabolism
MLKVAMVSLDYQHLLNEHFEFTDAARRLDGYVGYAIDVAKTMAQLADIVVFPEYSLPPEAVRHLIKDRVNAIVVLGSICGKMIPADILEMAWDPPPGQQDLKKALSLIVQPDQPILWTEKWQLTSVETQNGVARGTDITTFTLSHPGRADIRWAVPVCIDVLQPEIRTVLKDSQVNLVTAPCYNPKPQRFKSDLTAYAVNHGFAIAVANASQVGNAFGGTCVWAPIESKWARKCSIDPYAPEIRATNDTGALIFTLDPSHLTIPKVNGAVPYRPAVDPSHIVIHPLSALGSSSPSGPRGTPPTAKSSAAELAVERLESALTAFEKATGPIAAAIRDIAQRYSAGNPISLRDLFGELRRRPEIDLIALQDQGLRKILNMLQSTEHLAGVVISARGVFLREEHIAWKMTTAVDEKALIARAAVRRISSGDTVILDAGSTTLFIAREVSEAIKQARLSNLRIVTNSVAAAHELLLTVADLGLEDHNDRLELFMPAGRVRGNTHAVVDFTETRDEPASNMNDAIRAAGHPAAIAFVGMNGFIAGSGFTTASALERATKRAMLDGAVVKIIVTDPSKFRARQDHIFADVGESLEIMTTEFDDVEALRMALADTSVRLTIVGGDE